LIVPKASGRKSRVALNLLAVPLVATAGPVGAGAPGYEPTSHYKVRQVEGWSVLVSGSLLAAEPELAKDALELLGMQLYQVKRHVPAQAVAKLQKVRIWLNDQAPPPPCMTYHPGNLEWFREHGVNPDKARCVEISNPRNFLKWTHEQPWMVLHELAHAYHHQFLERGYENTRISAAYRNAMKAQSYASVLHWNGKTAQAYAATNPMEYFAEATEAYFGTNDMYPFVRAELARHDRRIYNLVESLWGVR
jgi:hypothetical protein